MSVGVACQTLLLCMVPTSVEGISSAELDRYIAQVEVVRKSCGPRAIWFCLRKLGKNVDWESVRDKTDGIFKADGFSLKDLLDLLRQFDAEGMAISGKPENLTLLPSPAIIVVSAKHCLVLDTVLPGDKVRVFEPTQARFYETSAQAIARNWTGQGIIFRAPGQSWAAFFGLIFLSAFGTALAGLAGNLCWKCFLRNDRLPWKHAAPLAAPHSGKV